VKLRRSPKRCRRRPWALCLLLLAAAAPDPILARAGATTITASALRMLLDSLPPDSRTRIAADPAALAELLRSEAVQALLYTQAHQAGWDKRAEVAAAAERARQAEIVRSYLASRIPPPLPPTDAQLQPLYEANKPRFLLPRQFHLAQIFRAVPATATAPQIEQARQALLALRAQCAGKPEAFAAAARVHSDDQRSAAAGGDLGWIADDKLVGPIKPAIAGLPLGALTDPVRTADGWHLIELIGTEPAGPASFDQARPTLAQAYAQQQTQAATRAALDAVLKRDPVEINQQAVQTMAGSLR
jgi:parvulin-like peptidyl-prolyl isomerase